MTTAETTVDTVEFLSRQRTAIIDGAASAIGRAHTRHYGSARTEELRQRLEALFDEVLAAVAARDLGRLLAYVEHLAEERFHAGYDLSEIQTAFNALEEATWSRVFDELPPLRFAETLGLVSTILGAAKDALARRYVSLATRAHAPSLDLRALFAGTEHLGG